ncbi:MAG TPA: D-2-hydroxyacid dehydrogenase family protein [Kofleriaceae bacterium]
MRVAVLDDYHEVFDGDPAIQRLRARVPVDVFTTKLESLERLRGYQIVIAIRERTKFDEAFFAQVPDLKLIAQTGNHAYHVDVAAATRAGVLVAMGSSNALSPAAGMTASTVEITFALMLALLRNVPSGDRTMREGGWSPTLGRTLFGKKLAILGLGRIGRDVANIARAFGMELLAWGPTLTDERAAASGARRMELDDALAQADIVSVHLALSDKSRGLLDERRLRLIGPRGYIINTARGAIVDEAALARVLAEKAIAGAALDVYAEEPLSESSPLRKLDNVVLSPHVGWIADQTYRCFGEAVVQIVEQYLDGTYTKAINPEATAHG